MKKIYALLLLCSVIITGCKTEKKREAKVVQKEYTILEKVANDLVGLGKWKLTHSKFQIA